MKEFYQMSCEETMTSINGHNKPLTSDEAKKNIEKYGLNQLIEKNKKPWLMIFIEQYKDFLVMILIASAIISFFLGEKSSAVVILVVITMNSILGTIQTIKAEGSLEGLREMSSPVAKVIRDNEIVEINSKEVTVGDIVVLEAGDYIPCDGRIIESASLRVDESALTGESLSVDKIREEIFDTVPLADRTNMAHGGSYVTYGRGKMVVTAIGMDTEIGKIAALLNSTKEKKTPLQNNLDSFGKKLSISILVLCGILAFVQIIKGQSIVDAFLFAVALAVAAIPEALSSIVTIVLAIGTQKMAKEGAIIRKLQAVEGLGSVSIICSDKTGTLTQNKMTVENYYVNGEDIKAEELSIKNSEIKKLLEFSILCNDSAIIDGNEIGDPTETALVAFGKKFDINEKSLRDSHKRLKEIPFDSDRKCMSTLNDYCGKKIMIVKGAVDVLEGKVTKIEKNGKIENISEEVLKAFAVQNQKYSENGLRVLCVAYRELCEACELTTDMENDLILVGLIAMMDPPRDESREAVVECKKAGITPIMITGDHLVTASAIAKRIGIMGDGDKGIIGSEIDKYSDEELLDFVKDIRVYARVTPEHKIRIVRAWQGRGNIVSMTGDGVNDAPALKQADIGVAMGITGTEVSKEAASMVLTDDNFATIVKAVENGRNVYANIKRAIQFLLSGNFAGILVVLLASLTNLPLPFAPVHLLFINLVTDSLPAIALGLEPYKENVMNQKPRNINESILTASFLKRIVIQGIVIGLCTFGAFLVGYMSGDKILASTMSFGTLCLGRLVHGYNCKSKAPVLFKKGFFNNKYMQMAFLAGAFVLTIVLVAPPLQALFSVRSLNLIELLEVYGCAFLVLPLIQITKIVEKRFKGE